MNEGKDSVLAGDENSLQIFAVMCRPGDPVSLLSEFAYQLDVDGWELTVDIREASISRLAAQSIEAGHVRAAADVAGSAAVAGLTLMFLFWMHGGEVHEPSLEKAQWLACQQAKRHTHRGGSKIGFTRAAVKSYWKDYKRVAHLWGAYQTLSLRSQDKSAPLSVIAEDSRRFLAVAKALHSFADQYRAKRTNTNTPLLPVDTWEIGPGIEPVTLKAPPLPDELVNDLEHYRNG